MRSAGRLKLGYFPLPLAEGDRIRRMLAFGPEPTSIVDPCVGTGTALYLVTKGANCRYYGIELDADRAAAANESGIATIHGNAFDVSSKVEQFSLLYLNPPYDHEIGAFGNERMESLFLKHTHRWLKPGGILVFVIPLKRMYDCIGVLSTYFSNVRVFRLADPESIRFDQGVIFGVCKSQCATAVEQSTVTLRRIANGMIPAPMLDDTAMAAPYIVPPSDEAQLTYKGLPLDDIEDLLYASNAWKQPAQYFLPKEEISGGHPLTPLHGGHVGLLCTAGLLNGVFGEGDDRHIARWRSNKHVTVFHEEGEDGEQIIRRRERFSNDLTLVYTTGAVQLLAETEQAAADSSAAGAADESSTNVLRGTTR